MVENPGVGEEEAWQVQALCLLAKITFLVII
jgi:hypothetical protein